MKFDETIRSFLMFQSLGINYGLLAFIAELNKTIAQMRQENRMQRQYQILLKFRDAAADVKESQQREKAEKLVELLQKAVNSKGVLEEPVKKAVTEAFNACTTIGKNCENAATFEELLKNSGIDADTRSTIMEGYRNALNEANRAKNDFYVYQLDVDDSKGAVIVAAVERQLRERGIPGAGFYDVEGNGKCFLHLYDQQSALIAKALMENELCRRSLCNIRSDESLQAIAIVTRQKVYAYEGLSQAEAGKFYEQAQGKGFPVYVGEKGEGVYSVEFLANTRPYAEKLLAETIAYTNGYSKEAGLDTDCGIKQSVRENIMDYLSSLYSEGQSVSEKNRAANLGYIIDTAPGHEGHRILLGRESITEIDKDGKETKIQKANNPDFYEDRVRNMIDNFSKNSVLITGLEAEKLGLYNENFKITDEVRAFIDKHLATPGTVKKPTAADIRSARIEQRFMSWAIRESHGTTAVEILDDIKRNYSEKVSRYKEFEMNNIQKQSSVLVQGEGNRQEAEAVIRKKKEGLEKDINTIFKDGEKEIRRHLNEFSGRLDARQLEPEIVMPHSAEYSIPNNVADYIRMPQIQKKVVQAIDSYASPLNIPLNGGEPIKSDQNDRSDNYRIDGSLKGHTFRKGTQDPLVRPGQEAVPHGYRTIDNEERISGNNYSVHDEKEVPDNQGEYPAI